MIKFCFYFSLILCILSLFFVWIIWIIFTLFIDFIMSTDDAKSYATAEEKKNITIQQ